MELDPSDLERLVPDQVRAGETTGSETLRLHLERYEFAARHLRPGRALDIACGVGYGTALLGAQRSDVSLLGVDIAASAIDYARRRYSGGSVEFLTADAMEFTDARGFDTIVSLETLEHLPQPAVFVDRLFSLLRPAGVLIISVPTTPSLDLNPYHRCDFTERSIRRLVRRHPLTEIACLRQVQRFRPLSILSRKEDRMRDLRRHLARYYLGHPRALLRRVGALLRYGFANHYMTIAWRAAPPDTAPGARSESSRSSA